MSQDLVTQLMHEDRKLFKIIDLKLLHDYFERRWGDDASPGDGPEDFVNCFVFVKHFTDLGRSDRKVRKWCISLICSTARPGHLDLLLRQSFKMAHHVRRSSGIANASGCPETNGSG